MFVVDKVNSVRCAREDTPATLPTTLCGVWSGQSGCGSEVCGVWCAVECVEYVVCGVGVVVKCVEYDVQWSGRSVCSGV